MNSLNRICALAMCEQMEYDLFTDETGLAIDMISGQPSDDEEDDKDIEALHGSDNINEGVIGTFLGLLTASAICGLVAAGVDVLKRRKNSKNKKDRPKEAQNPNEEFSKEDQSKIANILIKELQPYIKTVNSKKSAIKAAIKEEIKKFKSEDWDIEDLEYDLNNENIEFKITDWSYFKSCFTFEILNDLSQDTNCVLCAFTNTIGKEFCKNTDLPFVRSHGYADGDEGVLQIYINIKAAKEYLNGGK